LKRGSIEEMAGVVRAFQKKDFDWFHLNTGVERSGKTTLGMRMCYAIDPEGFNIDNIVFTASDFRRIAASSKKASAIMIDEGAITLFSREAMKYETRELIKILTVLGHKNHFIVINIPDITLIDTYIRTFRARSLSKIQLVHVQGQVVPRRGLALIFGRRTARKIRKSKDGHIFWPKPTGVIFYKKITKKDGRLWEIWKQYTKLSATFKNKIERGKQFSMDDKVKQHIQTIQANKKDFISEYNGRRFFDLSKIMNLGIGWKTAGRVKKALEQKFKYKR